MSQAVIVSKRLFLPVVKQSSICSSYMGPWDAIYLAAVRLVKFQWDHPNGGAK